MEKLIQKLHQLINNKKITIPAVAVLLLSGTLVLKNCQRRKRDISEVHINGQANQTQQVEENVIKKKKKEQKKEEEVVFSADLEGFSFVLDESINKKYGFRKKIKGKVKNPYSYSFHVYSDKTCTNLVKTYEDIRDVESLLDLDLLKENSENNFSIKVIDENELLSECIPGPSYIHKGCPMGYVPVVDYGQEEETDFCVMQTEAKKGGDDKAYSAFDEKTPWKDILANDAKEKCLDLGQGYNIMSNDQYMVLAMRAEKNPKNWLHGIVGEESINGKHNCIYMGNTLYHDWRYTDCLTGFKPGNSGVSKLYANKSELEGENYKRKLYIDEKEFVYDLVGNLAEIVDLIPETKEVEGYRGECKISNADFSNLNTKGDECQNFVEEKIIPEGVNYSKPFQLGMGTFHIENNSDSYVATRGGSDRSDHPSGLYAFHQRYRNDFSKKWFIGFRCTFKTPYP